MQDVERDDRPHDVRSEREKMLEEKLGGRTILLVFVALCAVIEALMLVQLTLK